MSRLRRFPENRFVGRRDEMIFYDCNTPEGFEALTLAVDELGLDDANLLQAFAPDSAVEAQNRGFKPTSYPTDPEGS